MATCLAAFLLKEALLPTLLAQVFVLLDNELVWEADPAEKYLNLWFRLDYFSAELNPALILGAVCVLVPAWCGE